MYRVVRKKRKALYYCFANAVTQSAALIISLKLGSCTHVSSPHNTSASTRRALPFALAVIAGSAFTSIFRVFVAAYTACVNRAHQLHRRLVEAVGRRGEPSGIGHGLIHFHVYGVEGRLRHENHSIYTAIRIDIQTIHCD